jgi:hypothetical protein
MWLTFRADHLRIQEKKGQGLNPEEHLIERVLIGMFYSGNFFMVICGSSFRKLEKQLMINPIKRFSKIEIKGISLESFVE